MKRIFFLFVSVFCFLQTIHAQIPTLGIYTNTTIYVGAINTSILPSVAPSNASSITASTTSDFKGILQVNPISGMVTIVNPRPAGTYPVVIKAFNGSSTVTSSFIVTVNTNNCSIGVFGDLGLNTGNNSDARSVCIGDFNGDGNQDLASANSTTNNVTVRLGSGAGAFTVSSTVAVGARPYAIIVEDFNGDGKEDIATANYDANTVSVRLGNGAGNFTGSTEISVGSQPIEIVAGDFNGDGIRDFITGGNASSAVSIRFGNGIGGFTGTSNLSIGQTTAFLAVADFNNDGALDFASYSYYGTLAIRLANGLGDFTAAPNFAVSDIVSMTCGDVNNDGKQDLVFSTYNGALVGLGNGVGGFTGITTSWSGYWAHKLTLGDVNSDGKLDLVGANVQGNFIITSLGNGNGTFAAPYSTYVGNEPASVTLGDFNNDGKMDFATALLAGNNVTFRLGVDNEIAVFGKKTDIEDGDVTPTISDNTDFGNVSVGTNTARTYYIKNTDKVPLVVTALNITGQDSALFVKGSITLPVTLAQGDSVSFTVTYNSAGVGINNAKVNIINNDCDEGNYDFSVQGNGVIITPAMGTYPPATIPTASGNISIAPSTPPIDAANIVVIAPAGFRGQIKANPATGVLTVTNGHPAGSYVIKVRAFNGVSSTAITSFTLTVGNTVCSQGLFAANEIVSAGTTSRTVAIGDFNNDGNQDILAPNNRNSYGFAIIFGNGSGGMNPGFFETSVFVATLAAGDFDGDGNLDVAFTNGSNLLGIRLGDGTGNFIGTTKYTVGNNASAIAVGDFNGDNKQDLAIAISDSAMVSIMLGDGQGKFIKGTNVVVGGKPVAIELCDINNDGFSDFITTNATNNNISVRFGDASGNFSGSTNIAFTSPVTCITLADFNGDGYKDIALGFNNGSGGFVSIKLGDSAGNFSGTLDLGGFAASQLSSADINGDGKLDLLKTSGSVDGVLLRLGDGTGNFGLEAFFSMGQDPNGIAVGDFNNDGRQDLATSGDYIRVAMATVNEINIQGNGTNILDGSNAPSISNQTDFGTATTLAKTFTIQNTGTGNLTVNNITIGGADSSAFKLHSINLPAVIAAGTSQTFKILFLPTAIGLKTATVYINNDDCDEALYDFALQGNAVMAAPTIGVYPNSTSTVIGGNTLVSPSASSTNASAITATAPPSFKGLLSVEAGTGIVRITNASPSGNYTIQVKAFNGFATTIQNFNLTVTGGACSQGLFTISSPFSISGTPQSAAILDYNNDGKQDILQISDGRMKLLMGNGVGGFTLVPSASTVALSGAVIIASADFNGDGNPDIATSNTSYNSVSIRLGDGNGNFFGNTDISVGSSPRSIAMGDFNKDGNVDFVVPNNGGNTLSIRLGNGLGAFISVPDVVVGTNPSGVVVVDVNNDGNPDLAACNYVNNTVSVRLGNGLGGFSGTGQFNVGSNPYCITSGDFNGDGKQDLATANFSSNNISVRFGNGAGSFSGTIDIAAGGYPNFITSGDMNGDGKLDLLCSAYSAPFVTMLTGVGNGTFTASSVPVSTGVLVVAIGDLNADGRADLAFSHTFSSSPTIALGSDKEINLRGNNNNITNGSLNTSVNNHTSFGSIAVGNTLTRTFTIQNVGTGNLVISNIMVTGVDSALFVRGGITFPATIAAAASKTFTVIFSPTNDGLKNAMINVLNDDCDEGMYSFAVKGGIAQPGAALQFDGVDDYISINTNAGNIDTGRTTISAWIKTISNTTSSILSKRNVCGVGNFFDFGITASGKLSIEFDNNGTANQQLTGSKIVNDGAWHQVAVVRKDSALSLYVDGILDSAHTGVDIVSIINNTPLLIGASGCSGASRFFKGEMDDLRFWGRVLSQPAIQNGLNCELTNTQTGLIAYYKFNQGLVLDSNASVTSLGDASGNANAGTLHNFGLTGNISNWTAQGGVATGATCSNINVWRGITSDWSLATNWSLGIVPFEESTVVINIGVPFMPEITDPASVCYGLTLTNGATVTIKSTGRLTVLGKN